MPRFEPFAGIRYDTSRVPLERVVAPPYDVLSLADVAALAGRDDHNVVRVDVPLESDGPDRYSRAAERFRQWRQEGVLVDDAQPAFYVYRMAFTDPAGATRHLAGVLGGLEVRAADEPGADVLPHEQTTPKATTDRLDLTRATAANLSPVWGLSLAPGLAAATEPAGDVLGEVTDADGVVHHLERVTEPGRIDAIRTAIAAAPVLIADGHHRYDVARTYRRERRAAGGDAPGPYDQTLAFVQPLAEDQLMVQAIHRLVHDIPDGVDVPRVLSASFEVLAPQPVTPAVTATQREHGTLVLVTPDGTGRELRPRPGAFDGVRDLDSARLDHALADLPHRLTYQHGVDEVLAALAEGAAPWAVLLRPVTVAQIAATADEGALMPPKSTFFWPKLRTGLVFRSVA